MRTRRQPDKNNNGAGPIKDSGVNLVTWLKLSDDFHDQCADLSDAAYRTHCEGLGWCMRRETGGYLSQREVRRFAESERVDEAVAELLEQGFWAQEGKGYRIVHHMEHQPEPDVLKKRREDAAERQRQKRRKAAKVAPMSRRDTQRDSQSDSARDDTRYPGRVGSGRDGASTGGSI